MLRGLSGICYSTNDMPSAIAWYSELVGTSPYFVRPVEGPPAYAEFRVGDLQTELGLIDRRYTPDGSGDGVGGVVTAWHVDDIRATFDRLVSLGAREHEPVTEQESGFVTASVVDPFGNVIGLEYNPHYLKMIAARTEA
ncbi:VOC family protein [Pseudonocardia sp. TRM90224]|uniref:VOC family protein n=1 Tax=Pseudonocardia sp. TRM90224 TaxID=2812678 RepID=UPI001E416B05|nr:VOC family protein [Pseudonocardia sp. TRM90224]